MLSLKSISQRNDAPGRDFKRERVCDVVRRWMISILGILFAVILCACGQKTPTWQEQYDLGIRYLSEGNYEEAIIAFTAAIEIDPKQVPAYVGRGDAYVMAAQSTGDTSAAQLEQEAIDAYQAAVKEYLIAIGLDEMNADVYRKAAEVYSALGDVDSAAAILEQGYQATEDEALRESADKLSGVIVPEDLREGSDEYASLEDFLSRFGWYWPDFDNKAVTSITGVYDEPTNLLNLMLSVPFCYSYNSELYPGESLQLTWDGSDPLGKFADTGYGKVSVSSMDWTLKNIFNCSQADITRMKEPILSDQQKEIYCRDDYYYFPTPGIGGGFGASITNIEQSGLRYDVSYDLQSMYEEEGTPFHAQVSLKEIDGEMYWSLYENQMTGQPCGDNLEWKLQMGTLTISGTGPMTDFNPYHFSELPAPPWGDQYFDSVVIEAGVTSIGSYAFFTSEYLTSVDISDSVTSIGDNAFWGCARLEDISIPNNVTTIGDYAFQACGFHTFSVPSSVESISKGMLAECGDLTDVTIAEGVKRIELGAFDACFSLRTLTIPGSMTYIDQYAIGGNLYVADIYFGGSRDQWEKYELPYYNDNVHYNSAGAGA